MTTAVVAERFDIVGVVQGVGFRPFVHRIAVEIGLAGIVGNKDSDVFIEVQGAPAELHEFAARLESEAPKLARISGIARASMKGSFSHSGFAIVPSDGDSGLRSHISPDAATCDDCLREMRDPSNRRFDHPFITCTNCGPRFTIVEDLPYDRVSTTMAAFTMCEECLAEYEDPSDRRFHAQPICCQDCGPKLSYATAPIDWPAGVANLDLSTVDPIERAKEDLRQGAILAVKGTGGYQLVCNAECSAAVQHLRLRKNRPDKPFALMVANVGEAGRLAHLGLLEVEQLQSSAAPIVLLSKRPGIEVSAHVAPGSPVVGIMLANNPVHHQLLSGDLRCLVVTSANATGSPMAFADGSVGELDALMDGVLSHDRPIHVPCDDSVVRINDGELLPMRRARGYAPIPLGFPNAKRNVLAVGAELKNTFCLAATDPGYAWISPHVGEMGSVETLAAFEAMVTHFRKMYGVSFDPERDVLVSDLHPEYLTTRWAEHVRSTTGIRVVRAQHHHAHICAVMAEYSLDPAVPVLGFAFDGTGFGPDGSMWGGEVLAACADSYRRLGHLATVALPGLDAAARAPFRSAIAHLHAAKIDAHDQLAPLRGLDDVQRGLLEQQLRHGFGCTTTSSMGRLFDAVASLLGLRQEVSFEAQAAIELEHLAHSGRRSAGASLYEPSRYRFDVSKPAVGVPMVANPANLLHQLVEHHLQGMPPGDLAWHFHRAIADLVVELATRSRDHVETDTVILSGGVFQNGLLTELCVEGLRESGFRPYSPRLVPANDGGIALGQAYIAAHCTELPTMVPTLGTKRNVIEPTNQLMSLLDATNSN